nr:MAG TPA: hypothetical protein [Caudoviricetes sp.]
MISCDLVGQVFFFFITKKFPQSKITERVASFFFNIAD